MGRILDESDSALLLQDGSFFLDQAGEAPVTSQTGSWWGLSNVLKQSQQEFDAEWSRPPVACPVCGEPLTPGPSTPRGAAVQLYCRFAGDHSFVYPRDWHPPTRPSIPAAPGGLT